MTIIQLSDYDFCQDDVVPGLLIQGDIGQIYDQDLFNDFLASDFNS
jgi:hypothetical protein